MWWLLGDDVKMYQLIDSAGDVVAHFEDADSSLWQNLVAYSEDETADTEKQLS